VRNAPPFSVLCRGRAWLFLQAVVMALSAAIAAAWVVQHLGASAAAAGCAAAAVAVAVALVSARTLRHPPVQLQWDGSQWLADGRPVAMALMLDLGSALLLRWRPAVPARSAWLSVSAREAGANWHALRTALYARVPESGSSGSSPAPSWR
jgi:hypothetical protein